MLCYWGEEEGVRAGFGLVKPGGVQRTQSGVSFCSPGGRITQLAAGQRLLGLIRGDGSASVLRLTPSGAPCEGLNLNLNDKIQLMSCGETQAVLVVNGGKIIWMNQSNICRMIFHVVLSDGQLFTWGENSSGQLGLGRVEPSFPQPLRSLCGIPLAQISAGGDHSFALSMSGAVFGWGRNNSGQLGLGDTEDRYTPASVTHLSLKRTVFISCGEDHTATLSKGGTVFTFGSGCFGQLGHNSFIDELRPRVVTALWGSKVSHITCGRHHTLTLVHSSNTVYSFGRGQMGNGQQTNQCVSFLHGNNSDYPKPKQERRIVVLEDRQIDRWIRECDTKYSECRASLILFIVLSCDGHYQTSTNFSGLDLESVRAAFERLAEKDKVLSEIVENKLLPSLGDAAFDVEALRVYLILPELLRVLNKPLREMKLTAELASAILRLDSSMLQVLENYCSELTDDFIKTLVELFRNPIAKIISQKTFNPQADITDEHLKKYVQVLQLVYKVNYFYITLHYIWQTLLDFFIYEINTLLDIVRSPSLPEDRYFLFGCLCGLVFYNNSVVNLPFPLALFKKLLNVQPSLEDLTEFSPVLGNAEMPYTVSVCLLFFFCDRKKFVEAYVDHAMNGSVERVFEEFRRGFYKVCDRDLVEVFQPEELRGVMAGSEECDWDILKQNVTYEGLFHPKHPTIISFWEVFDELSDRNKKAFLLFLTGFDRVPVLGMNQVKMRVCPRLPSTQDHLPEALTCHSLLQLPVYNTKETLQAKLTEALQHKRGFWDD
uniref:Si:ch73-190m4.1 n=1 Tax=Astyanax mexicanus TaxID=7994 RepID=A0A3B1JZV9_ASTMX